VTPSISMLSLIAIGGNAGGDLSCPGGLGHGNVQGIHPPLEGAPNKHCPKQAPVVLIHLARQP
jgi:hypothetical protein